MSCFGNAAELLGLGGHGTHSTKSATKSLEISYSLCYVASMPNPITRPVFAPAPTGAAPAGQTWVDTSGVDA
ncbi:hypothetical protein GCM10010172_07030 [Paractinoplanes ferrugineus]|uniref:Uncharacterized protein n=1 Tax=Paractinoplanes ferrugineus TaxID=113564 RepID=A0A919JBI8_9ACTN|nr:hypothetical protein Afe05nite_81090 [Actinoplanes ferrugineus]